MKNRVYILALVFAAFCFGGCEKLDFPDEKKTETEQTDNSSKSTNQNQDGKENNCNDDDGSDSGNDDDGNDGGGDNTDGNTLDNSSVGDGFYHGFETIIDYISYFGNYNTPVPYEDVLKGGCLYVELVDKNDETITFTKLNDMWMEGYVVGFVNGRTMKSTVFDTGNVATNIVIAERADVSDVEMCVPVQLTNNSKSNQETRSALNLKDHPEVLGKKVKIKGDIAKYMGVVGIRNAKEHVFQNQD
ncbi:MAG: hypothetical protein IJ910_04045 [Bacteroidaceae bacterium]|nr:hypothetical protein [Bacteroidaceae bacterium]